MGIDLTLPQRLVRIGYPRRHICPRLSLILEVNYACHLSSFILL